MSEDEIPKEVFTILNETREKITKHDDECEKKADELEKPLRASLNELFKKRQPHLDQIDGFWGNTITAEDCPLSGLMNHTTDPRLSRAITSIQMEYIETPDDCFRKITMELRKNIFTEAAKLVREVGKKSAKPAVNVVALKWNDGTEATRKDSIFGFFGDSMEEMNVIEIANAFDLFFSNPSLYLEA